MNIIVIERDNRICNKDARDRIIGGSPLASFESARELIFVHREWGNEIVPSWVDNGTNYDEIDGETGEVIKQYFVRTIGIPGL